MLLDTAKWWWIAGFFLLLMELYLPSISFWLAGAAFSTGVVVFFWPKIDLGQQIILFSVISILSIFVFQMFFSRRVDKEPSNHLNEGLNGYIGRRTYTVTAIEQGSGQVKLDGVPWHVTGLDCPENTPVQIVGVDNNMTFKVKIMPR